MSHTNSYGGDTGVCLRKVENSKEPFFSLWIKLKDLFLLLVGLACGVCLQWSVLSHLLLEDPSTVGGVIP